MLRARLLCPDATHVTHRIAAGVPLHRRVVARVLQFVGGGFGGGFGGSPTTVVIVNQQPQFIPVVRRTMRVLNHLSVFFVRCSALTRCAAATGHSPVLHALKHARSRHWVRQPGTPARRHRSKRSVRAGV
jgi:hypothetical protein